MNRIGFFLLIIVIAVALVFLPSSVSAAVVYTGRIEAVDTVATAFPANGDLNAHGIALIPSTVDSLVKGNFLVSHFNNSQNLPGTGTSIVQISPGGDMRLFAQIDPAKLPGKCDGGVGLTGLAVLRSGWVIAGSLSTSDGQLKTARPGCLIVLDSRGQVVETIASDLINGPWSLALSENSFYASLFVSNVLNGPVAKNGQAAKQGSVVRINLATIGEPLPRVVSQTVVASGFIEEPDPKGLITGPSGLAATQNGTLYIADAAANRIAAVPDAVLRITSAGTGDTIIRGGSIRVPSGLALTPNGHILVVNAVDGHLVEVTPSGSQIDEKAIDAIGSGDHTLFGLAITRDGVYFLNDGDDALNILH